MEYIVGEKYRVMSKQEAYGIGFYNEVWFDDVYCLSSTDKGTLFGDELYVLDKEVTVLRISDDCRYAFVDVEGLYTIECPKALLVPITHPSDLFDVNDISMIV